MHDKFLHDIYTSPEAEDYFSKIVGEEMAWLTNSWDASHMNVQEKSGLDTKIFDWHMDSQPLTLIINVSDMPKEVIGGSTILRKHDDGAEIELKQPAPGMQYIVLKKKSKMNTNQVNGKSSKSSAFHFGAFLSMFQFLHLFSKLL